MAFLSFRGITATRKGLWREDTDLLTGGQAARATFTLPPAGHLQLLVFRHAWCGRWRVVVNGHEHILDAYSPTNEAHAFDLQTGEAGKRLTISMECIGGVEGSQGAEISIFGFELDTDVQPDIAWAPVDQDLQRLRILANPYLTLDERLYIVSALDWQRGVEVVEKRYREEGGTPYFQFDPYRIYFAPPWAKANPPSALDHKGPTSVMVETFIWPYLFASKVNVRPGDTVIDLGANIGTTSLLFSDLVGPKGRVVAVEPVLVPVLETNLRANGVGNVTVCPIAVDQQPGSARMYATDYVLDTSLIAEHSALERVAEFDVRLETLDNLVRELSLNRVDFIKMDIEGVEEEAILGARDVIARFRPKWSISSYHKDRQRRPQHDRLVNLLRSLNYQLKEMKTEHIFAW